MHGREQAAFEDYVYRAYISDALKCIAENTMHFAGGSSMTKRWVDVVETKEPEPEDPRPCKEIAADIFKRIRGENK